MIITRKETWGHISYDTSNHVFRFNLNSNNKDHQPYVSEPVWMCIYITFDCNLDCLYCVVKDLTNQFHDKTEVSETISKGFIDTVNRSPVMAISITGGEPLLKKCEDRLLNLIRGIKKKGLLLDTNGTSFPSKNVIDSLKKRKVLVRVSWDTLNPNEEAKLRKYPKGMYKRNLEYIDQKIEFIRYLQKHDVLVAVQSVIHGLNILGKDIELFPKKLKDLNVDRWYLQRYIPSHKLKDQKRFNISTSKYGEAAAKAYQKCKNLGILCISKKDRRHNSVLLATTNGDVFTQDDVVPGKKIYLGKLADIKHYFEFVSSSDHSDRYY